MNVQLLSLHPDDSFNCPHVVLFFCFQRKEQLEHSHPDSAILRARLRLHCPSASIQRAAGTSRSAWSGAGLFWKLWRWTIHGTTRASDNGVDSHLTAECDARYGAADGMEAECISRIEDQECVLFDEGTVTVARMTSSQQ